MIISLNNPLKVLKLQKDKLGEKVILYCEKKIVTCDFCISSNPMLGS